MIDSYMIQLLDYSAIDFTNGYEISAYNHLLISLMQHSELLDYRAASTATSRQLLQKSKEWIKTIENNITVTPVHNKSRKDFAKHETENNIHNHHNDTYCKCFFNR